MTNIYAAEVKPGKPLADRPAMTQLTLKAVLVFVVLFLVGYGLSPYRTERHIRSEIRVITEELKDKEKREIYLEYLRAKQKP